MSSTNKASQAFISVIKSDSIDSQYDHYHAESESDKILSDLKMIERVFPEYVVMLCNRSHPKLQYVGENCEDVFGVSNKKFMSTSVQEFLTRIHPDDLGYLQQCFEFIDRAEPYDPLKHRFVMYYRFKKENGEYMHLRDEKLAIETDEKKFIYFTMFKDISTQEKFFNVKLDVVRYNKSNALKIYTYNPRQSDRTITPRQNDIISLMIKGFSTQEIANKLHISVSTIKNHKRALFQKINVKTSVQLVNFASKQEQPL